MPPFIIMQTHRNPTKNYHSGGGIAVLMVPQSPSNFPQFNLEGNESDRLFYQFMGQMSRSFTRSTEIFVWLCSLEKENF